MEDSIVLFHMAFELNKWLQKTFTIKCTYFLMLHIIQISIHNLRGSLFQCYTKILDRTDSKSKSFTKPYSI